MFILYKCIVQDVLGVPRYIIQWWLLVRNHFSNGHHFRPWAKIRLQNRVLLVGRISVSGHFSIMDLFTTPEMSVIERVHCTSSVVSFNISYHQRWTHAVLSLRFIKGLLFSYPISSCLINSSVYPWIKCKLQCESFNSFVDHPMYFVLMQYSWFFLLVTLASHPHPPLRYPQIYALLCRLPLTCSHIFCNCCCWGFVSAMHSCNITPTISPSPNAVLGFIASYTNSSR